MLPSPNLAIELSHLTKYAFELNYIGPQTKCKENFQRGRLNDSLSGTRQHDLGRKLKIETRRFCKGK
jgi:hypothetical protein